MNNYAQGFASFLDAKGVKYDMNENDGTVFVSVTTGAKNTESIRVNIIFYDNDEHVSLCSFAFITATEETYANALIACNECNQKYRWVKFVVDKDMDVNAMDDALIGSDNANEELFELMIRMMQIVDESYPIFESALNN